MQSRSEFGYSEEDIVVGCVAVLSQQKGVNYLLNSAHDLVEQELCDQSSQHGLDGKVKFTGWRSDALRLLGRWILLFCRCSERLADGAAGGDGYQLPIIVTDMANNMLAAREMGRAAFNTY